MKKMLLFSSALTVTLIFTLLAIGRTSPPLIDAPSNAASPSATPTFEEMMKSLADGIDKLKKGKAAIENEMKEKEKDKAANEVEMVTVVQNATPLAQQAEETVNKLEELKGKFEAHGGRCHAGQLEQGAYSNCLTEHKEIADAFDAQQKALEGLDKQLEPYRTRFETLQKEHEEYEKKLSALKEEQAKAEEKIRQYLALQKKLTKCNDPNASLEAISQCGQVAWDGARDAGTLPDELRKPFVATENGTVDARDVPKMSDEERRRLQNAPAVQRPTNFNSHSAPPPSPKP